MKTVVRLLVAAGIVFTAVLAFMSCDDDDKDDQTSIIGTWQLMESKVDVTPTNPSKYTENQLEGKLSTYLLIPINSRVVFSNTNVTFPVSVNGATAQNKNLQYSLNDGVLTIMNPMTGVTELQGGVNLKDDKLEIELTRTTYKHLLDALASTDADFKDYVDNIAEASVYYRLQRIR